MPAQQGQFKLPGGLAIPAVGLVLTIWLISHSTADIWMIVGALFAVGTLVFWFSTRNRANPAIDL